jgi:Zn-dependent metalloprotease
MNLRLTLLAASLALLSAGPVMAQGNLMADSTAFASPQQSAGLLAALAVKHGLSTDHGFVIATEHPGVIGTKITRVNHTFKNVRIWHSESVLVTDNANNILSESISDLRAGLGKSNAALTAGAKDLDVTPKLAANEAVSLMVKDLAPNGTHIAEPKTELIIYPITKSVRVPSALNKSEAALNAVDLTTVVDGYELAYLVQTRMLSNGKPVLHDSIVSAVDGHLLKRISAMHTEIGVGHSQYNGDVPINTTLSGGSYSMVDASRGTGGTYSGMAITNANHGTTAGSVYTNPTNVWGDGLQYIAGGSTTNANGQTAAVNAQWGLQNTYDMLKNTMGWLSLDGRNTATYIAAHVNTAYDNAYYDDTCKCMYIGDGSSFYSLGSIDVIGHEMSHGVTASTSNLTYAGESGGLNESNSDIGGEMVEAYARNGGTGTTIPAGNDWFVGKEIAKNGIPLRFMQKPSKDGGSPDAWSSGISGLDVHYSSGPNNRMFYFLSQGSNATVGDDAYSGYLNRTPAAMSGIGNDSAYRIWFKANTTKFTASTDYADARTKVIQSAQELFGVGSKEEIAVRRAYAAINVGADADEIGFLSPVFIASQPASVSLTVGGTASFAVTADAGKAPYTYLWYKNGKKIAGATAATYSFVPTAADSGAKLQVRVTDSSDTPGTVSSNNAILTVNPIGTVYERLINGGFESGATGWSGTVGDIGAWDAYGEPAYQGSNSAYLGGYGTTSADVLYQTVTISPTATKANLSFALHIDTAETSTTAVRDKIVITVKSNTGTTLATLATYSNLNKAAGYQLHTFDLSAFKGQTVRINFAETENASLQTSFLLDAVSLTTD